MKTNRCIPPKRHYIGITLGDPSGIGPEVVAKALSNPLIRTLACFKIIGDYETYHQYSPILPQNCSFIDLNTSSTKKCSPGTVSKESGKAALAYLQKAIELLKKNKISALVTAPVSKEAICLTKPSFQGHTEFLAQAFNKKNVGMMFVADGIKTIIVTRHIPLKNVSKQLTIPLIFKTIELTFNTLKNLFKIKDPKIAVCGLNPHAGEGGNIGREEQTIIIPAIKKAKQKGFKIDGPLAADTLFVPSKTKNYDAIISMYHDQGLTPIKALYFHKLVNLTIGLPFIRTSPSHGTALDLAGKNQADASSMEEAIKLAVHLTKKNILPIPPRWDTQRAATSRRFRN